MICTYFDNISISSSVDLDKKDIFSRIEKARINARKEMSVSDKEHVLFAIRLYSSDGELESIQIHRNTQLSDEELDNIIKAYPNAYFEVLHKGTCQKACKNLIEREKHREIRPITVNYSVIELPEHLMCVSNEA